MSELKARGVDDVYIEYYNTGKHELAQVYLKSEADKVIAEKDAEIRRLQRALWMHRAITAKLNKDGCKAMREYNPMIGIEEYLWQEVERKCRAKAEEYK